MCSGRDQIGRDWNKGNRDKSGICGRILKLFVVGILLAGMCAAGAGEKVSAARNSQGNSEEVLGEYNISIQADMLPSVRDTYDIRLTVENLGENWEGTMRLMMDTGGYGQRTAYDTVLSLPQGSAKQFVVRVPKDGLVDDMAETVRVTMLDRKSNKCAEKEFRNLLKGEANALPMGILSDAYSTITYLDMGGEELYFNGDLYPIKLVELTQENLADTLDALTFLVIDRYNTNVLTKEETAAIESWVNNGGVLLVGTGSYGEDTLGGLDNLGIRCVEIHQPGQGAQGLSGYMDVETVELSGLPLAELDDVAGEYGIYSDFLYIRGWGNGAVGVLPFSFTELAGLDKSAYAVNQEHFVMMILSELTVASSHYSLYNISKSDTLRLLKRDLSILGNSSSQLNFGVLKGIVILYVIIVGPILYLILRGIKKRELYWAAVPAVALVGIFLVFLAGRGFEVASTRVYSVAVENLADKGNGRTYLHCYDASHKEWDLRLTAGHEYVGPFIRSYSYMQDENYYYHIRREGDTLFFGINPTSNFEDSYFCAGGVGGEISGELVCDDIEYNNWLGITSLSWTIRNGTDRDFLYYAVVQDDQLFLFEDLPAGETRKMSYSDAIYSVDSQSWHNTVWSAYLNDYMADIYDGSRKADLEAVAALGVGGCAAYAQDGSASGMVIGVTKDWEKAVDDTCSEVSYGCFYTVW